MAVWSVELWWCLLSFLVQLTVQFGPAKPIGETTRSAALALLPSAVPVQLLRAFLLAFVIERSLAPSGDLHGKIRLTQRSHESCASHQQEHERRDFYFKINSPCARPLRRALVAHENGEMNRDHRRLPRGSRPLCSSAQVRQRNTAVRPALLRLE